MTFLWIADFHLEGLNEKEAELNLCSIYYISAFTVFIFFILNHVKQELAIIYITQTASSINFSNENFN